MKDFVFFLAAFAAIAGLVAFRCPCTTARRRGRCAELRYGKSSRIPRLAVDFLGP